MYLALLKCLILYIIKKRQEIYITFISFLRKKEISTFIWNKKIFQYFEGEEDFIKQLREEICDRKKIC